MCDREEKVRTSPQPSPCILKSNVLILHFFVICFFGGRWKIPFIFLLVFKKSSREQMFTTDTQLRQETADQALKDIMTATLQDMFQDAAQVLCLSSLIYSVIH